MDFVNKPLLTGELDEVPGLGEVGINTLNRSGIFTTYQVIGKYLEFGRDAEKLHTWLVRDMGCHAPSMTRHQTAQQIARRVLIKGFKCEIKLSDGVIKSSHSHFGDDKKRAFMNKKLTGNLTVDFTGIKEVTVANLAAVGITNSDGLFAAFLSIIDNPNPMANTDKCDQFYEQLGRWKVASGYKATIIYQLQSKLAVGIDSSNVGIEYCQQLDAIPEHSSPRTAEQSRALPPRALPPQTGRELFPSLDTEQLAEKAAADVVEISRTEYMTGRAKQRKAKQLAIASAGSRSAYAIPVALLAFVLAYLYWPLRLVALVLAYMYWRNSR